MKYEYSDFVTPFLQRHALTVMVVLVLSGLSYAAYLGWLLEHQ